MALRDFFSRMFGNKEVEVNMQELEQVQKQQKYGEVLDKIKLLNVDFKDLALSRIESESETINSYLKELIKDIMRYSDLMDNKERQRLTVKAISGKIRVITQHSLELKNLLAHLEERYYNYLISVLKDINKANIEDIKKLVDDLEKEKEIIVNLDTKITRITAYDYLFNPEKNSEYEGEIKKEVERREIHTNINDITSHLLSEVIAKGRSLKSKIERRNIAETVKKIIDKE